MEVIHAREDKVTESLPYTELLQIHNCLRREVDKLVRLVAELLQSAGSESKWTGALHNLLRQFDFFFVVYHSHSKAEDEVILPALCEKGLAAEADQELRAEHCGQSKAFEDVRVALLHLRGENVAELNSQQSSQLKTFVDHLVERVDSIRSSVWLHLKKEEEELFPLLTQKFAAEELEHIAGHILGNRSSELVNCYLEMIVRDLPPKEQSAAINSIRSTAQGTRFSKWLEHVSNKGARKQLHLHEDQQAQGLEIVTVPEGSMKGSTISLHQCQEETRQECCPTAALTTFGCKHYKRGCKLFMDCCNELFCCRLCHDEAIAERSAMNPLQVKWHQANRFEVKRMWCMACHTLQPVGKTCKNCNREMAKYFCSICNLFDDADERPIYHCPFCNVCRRGRGLGVDLFHCMKCNACISTRFKDHKCMDHSMEVDCSICMQGLFETTQPVQMLQCGHIMHRDCYHSYITTNFQCPLCRKSVCDMSLVWRKYDEVWAHVLSEAQSSSVSLRYTQVHAHCNDCQSKHTVTKILDLPDALYALPLKCPSCGSYNTSVPK